MRYSHFGFIAIALTWGVCVNPESAAAQETEAELRREVRQLEGRVAQLEAQLDSLLGALRGGAVLQEPGPRDEEAELEALRAAAREAAGVDEAPAQPEPQASRTRSLQILNPEISATGDIVGTATAPAGEDTRLSAVPREFEFSFQASLDPFANTKIFVTHANDFEIAGLGQEAPEEGAGGSVEIEEGYLYWVGLPLGFGAKVGKFRQEVGLYNRWHTHALFEVERPLAAVAFLGEDGLIQTGGAVTFPSFSLGPTTNTGTLEVTAGSNDALFEGGNQLSFLANLRNFWDLSASSYVQLGATGVYGKNDDVSLDTRLLGLEASYRWAPPGRSLYRGFSLKGEWYFGWKDLETEKLQGNGGYLQANYKLGLRWVLGGRADYVDEYGDGPNIFQFAPSLSWWQSEWVRFRLQYNYVKPEGGSDNHTLLLQSVWAVGPHKHETY